MNDSHVIFDRSKLPARNLWVERTISNRFQNAGGKEIEYVKSGVIRELAQVLANNDEFIQITSDGPVLQVIANCIILTQEELASLLKNEFKAGMNQVINFNHFSV